MSSFFFEGQKKYFYSVFSSLLGINALTRKINFHRNLIFGYRQDTKQADHDSQKRLCDVRSLFCNTGIWAKKASFLAFLVLLRGFFLAKALAFDVSMCYLKNRNV